MSLDDFLADFLPRTVEQQEIGTPQNARFEPDDYIKKESPKQEDEPPRRPLDMSSLSQQQQQHADPLSPPKKQPRDQQRQTSKDVERFKAQAEESLLILDCPDWMPTELSFALIRKARVAQAQAVLKERREHNAWVEAQRQRNLQIMRELNPYYAHRYQ